MKTNRKKAREMLHEEVAIVFDAAEMVERWGRYDLGSMLRAIAFDFQQGGEITTAPKRRLPGQPSLFVANRRRARVDEINRHRMTGTVR